MDRFSFGFRAFSSSSSSAAAAAELKYCMTGRRIIMVAVRRVWPNEMNKTNYRAGADIERVIQPNLVKHIDWNFEYELFELNRRRKERHEKK